MSEKKCPELIWHKNGWGSHLCDRPAKVLHEGNWYCGIHDPAKEIARRAKWQAERDAQKAVQLENERQEALNARKLELFPVLVEALDDIEGSGTIDCQHAQRARIALDKVKELEEPKP